MRMTFTCNTQSYALSVIRAFANNNDIKSSSIKFNKNSYLISYVFYSSII